MPTLAAPTEAELASGVRSTVEGSAVPISGSGTARIDAFIGKTLDDRYTLDELLGEGGMGVVYLGRHKVIDKRVAVKILRGDLAADAEMTDRFLNEARAASSIGNPHIVDISDFGRTPEGSAYFVMEFLDGTSLAEVMETSGVIPVPRLVHIAKQIARGLAAAHARGIVHRDLKPDNVMLVQRGDDRDFVKILDFGIAKVSSEAGRLTRAGSVFGTPHYMSPEQAAGVPVDQRTDIYSLGVILYEMAAGRVPFDADNFMGILTQHMYKSPAPIRALVPQPQEVPPGLEAVVLKCLSKKVELRYQSMDEVVADLDKVERGNVPDAVQEMMGRSGGFNVPADYFRKAMPTGAALMPATPTLAKRKPVLAAVIVSVLAVALVITGVVIATSLRAAPPEGGAGPTTGTAPSAGQPAGPAQPSVQIVTSPLDAHVFQDDKDLGSAPLSVTVPPSTTLTLRVEREGYVGKTVTVDGSKTRLDVTLVAEAKPVPKPAATFVAPAGKPGTKPPGFKPTSSTPPPAPTTKPDKNAPCPAGQTRMMGECTHL